MQLTAAAVTPPAEHAARRPAGAAAAAAAADAGVRMVSPRMVAIAAGAQMGEGYTIGCTKCGREITYMLGVGMMYGSLERVLEFAVHWRHRAKIREILQTSEPDSIDYEHKIFACPKCDTLYSRFDVEIRKNNVLLYKSRFRCTKCRSGLTEPKKDLLQHRCRYCSERALEYRAEMLWD